MRIHPFFRCVSAHTRFRFLPLRMAQKADVKIIIFAVPAPIASHPPPDNVCGSSSGLTELSMIVMVPSPFILMTVSSGSGSG